MLLFDQIQSGYPKLMTIMVYPDVYTSRTERNGGDNGKTYRHGESWPFGIVVLSWDTAFSAIRICDVDHGL